MKCFSVGIVFHPEGTATVSYEGSTGCSYRTVVSADCAVLFSSYLIGWARSGLLFDEDGSMSFETMRDLDAIASMCVGGECRVV